MNINIIAVVLGRLAVIYIWIVITLVCVVVPVLLVVYLVGLAKRSKGFGNEWKLFRMELGKLSDEVSELRRELKSYTGKKGGEYVCSESEKVNSKKEKERKNQ